MTKTRFRLLLAQAGVRQRQAARDLEMHEQTLSRWRGRVPPYAAAYALLMADRSPADQELARAEMMADADHHAS